MIVLTRFGKRIQAILNKMRPGYKNKSYAINDLDIKLRKFLSNKNGFFIEAGANDGISQSNTLFFEKYRGWEGLLIEPIPFLAEKCKKNRPGCIIENCALVSEDYSKPTIEMHYCNLMSIVKGFRVDEKEYIDIGKKYLRGGEDDFIISVPAFTLNELMSKHKISHVDLLSLDVEGYEFEALKGIDFSMYRIDYLLIEVFHKDRENINNLLSNNYQPISTLSQNEMFSDILYRHKGNKLVDKLFAQFMRHSKQNKSM